MANQRILRIPKFDEGTTPRAIIETLRNKEMKSREIADQLLANEGILPQTTRARLHELTHVKILEYNEKTTKYKITKEQLAKLQTLLN